MANINNTTTMYFEETKGVALARFQGFSRQTGISHFVSTRKGGISKGPFESLNLSLRVSETNGIENRKILAETLGISPDKLIFPNQCHTDRVKVVDQATKKQDLAGTDALVTAVKGICIGVMVADCVPVLLYDKKLHLAGIAHAGWRGTVQSIVSKTVATMAAAFGSTPSDILAAIGPSISVNHYEVGEEVIEKVMEVFGTGKGILIKSSNPGKAYFDLWEANRFQLIENGILPNNIEVAGICTYRQSDLFFSARKLGPDSGRFGAGIMLY